MGGGDYCLAPGAMPSSHRLVNQVIVSKKINLKVFKQDYPLYHKIKATILRFNDKNIPLLDSLLDRTI